MSQALGGAVVSAVLVAAWLLGRRRPALIHSTDAAAVAALNRTQMALVAGGGSGAASADAGADAGGAAAAGPAAPKDGPSGPELALAWPLDRPSLQQLGAEQLHLQPPHDARSRAALLHQLQADYAAAGVARRRALARCVAWGDRATLPLVQRGLRDADPVVAGLAARAMEAFRGRSQAPAAGAQPPRLPRNVSRTL
ncbi:hypothetical protein [Vulcanococcus limneticus]|uniref:hypothetical protein n=1 Tax=Vulcanococcus limneticus TaxID=2170428 RepID=UPI00398BE8F9